MNTIAIDPDMKLINGDCLEKLKDLEDNSVDSIVTDPPAGIAFMGNKWDSDKGGRDSWIEWMSGIAKECFRVLKPGGHSLVWALPRTTHWTGTAWENGGFECRDIIHHAFGTGFPKALDIGKAVDKLQGNKRESLGRNPNSRESCNKDNTLYKSGTVGKTNMLTKGSSPYEGWKTTLKPAVEHYWLLRKPLSEKSVAENALKWGTGGINIDGCRVGTETVKGQKAGQGFNNVKGFGVNTKNGDEQAKEYTSEDVQGRFPANLIHDGSEEVVSEFPNSKASKASKGTASGGIWSKSTGKPAGDTYGDKGSAARFFKQFPPLMYIPKASKKDRNSGCEKLEKKQSIGGGGTNNSKDDVCGEYGSIKAKAPNYHPTTKNTVMMAYFCKLITPTGGTVLDPFMGSGSTGVGAKKEGFGFIGIELDKGYYEIAKTRIENTKKTLL